MRDIDAVDRLDEATLSRCAGPQTLAYATDNQVVAKKVRMTLEVYVSVRGKHSTERRREAVTNALDRIQRACG